MTAEATGQSAPGDESADEVTRLRQELAAAHARIASLEEELEVAREGRSAFAAAVSHELLTPLNHIIGYSGILLLGMSGELSGEQRSHLETVNSAGKHLARLIEDVIDFTRLEAGALEMRVTDVDADAAIRAACELMERSAREKGLCLRSAPSPATVWVRTDRERLRQVLIRLISNAVRFSDAGEIVVAATVRGDRVRFSVSDTGSGVSEPELERAFDAFTQIDVGGLAKPSGLGLGLAMARGMVERLGGRMWARSVVGEGSAFLFELPAASEDDGDGRGFLGV